MADQPVTKEKLINADIDVENLGKAVNEFGVVSPRYGEPYPTLPSAIQAVIETGGFEPFLTEAALLASTPVLSIKAAKALDTGKIWYWDGAWHDTGLSELDQAKEYTDTTVPISNFYENLINPDQQVTQGYFNGAVIVTHPTSYQNYYIMNDYFSAKSGDQFWLSGIGSGADQIIQFYDKNKTGLFTSNYSGAVSGGILTVPTDSRIAFVRFGTSKGISAIRNGDIAIGRGGEQPTKIPKYGYADAFIGNSKLKSSINNLIDDSNSIFLEKTKNLVNPNQSLQQGYFSSTGIVTHPTSYQNYWVGLDYYEVKKGLKYWVLGIGTGYCIQFYDFEKNVLGLINSAPGQSSAFANNILTIPSLFGGKEPRFVRICTSLGKEKFLNGEVGFGVGNVPHVMPTYDNHYLYPSDLFLRGISNSLGIEKSHLNNKVWVAMGDSITNRFDSYAYVLATKYGAELRKHTRDGARVHRYSDDASWNYLIMCEEYLNIKGAVEYNSATNTWDKVDSFSAPDLITIAAGTNDGLTNNHLGSFDDRTKYTFYGALHILLSGLRLRFPDSRIGFIAPIPRGSRYVEGDLTNTHYQKWKAIKEVCAYYSVPCWNGNTEFGASPIDSTAWKDTYMPDSLHPNSAGHVWYANRVEDFILSLAK